MPDDSGSSRSYTSRGTGLSFVRDGVQLLRAHYAGGVAGQVAAIVARLQDFERSIDKAYGFTLAGKCVLDLGAGQRLNQLAYFSLRTDAIGIDSDVIVQGFDVPGYLRMLRLNGARRTLKTIARKMLLVDLRYRREMAKQLHVSRIPKLRVIQMVAERLGFADESFDLVYSQSVFSHLHDPERVLAEMVRVLRPGGVIYIDFLLYTARTGCMDVRVLGGRSAELPLWAHLRPEFEAEVRESAFLNKIRLARWVEIFERAIPGAEIAHNKPEAGWLLEEAQHLHASGELGEYSIDELVTSYLTVTWRKPVSHPVATASSSSDTVTSS